MQLSADPSTPAESLLPVPTFLFQGSILLGSLCESVLGVSASGKQLVHPFLIAGWCGLFTQVRATLLRLHGPVIKVTSTTACSCMAFPAALENAVWYCRGLSCSRDGDAGVPTQF